MKPPLDRDRQIELMEGSTARHEARMRAHLVNPTIRDVLRRPVPGHDDHVEYLRTDTKVACCG